MEKSVKTLEELDRLIAELEEKAARAGGRANEAKKIAERAKADVQESKRKRQLSEAIAKNIEKREIYTPIIDLDD